MAERFVILENIRSAHNVGSIFRTADAACVSHIYLVGYTPCPVDRFGREQSEIKKTSLGASAYIPWEHCDDMSLLIKKLQAEQVEVVAIEQADRSVSLQSFTETRATAYIFGNETEGVAPETLGLVDSVVAVPMYGRKESLNVSVCAGVVLYGTLLKSR